MATVRLDGMLRRFVAAGSVTIDAPNVSAVIDQLEQRYPRLQFRLRDESGALRRFVRIFVNGEDVSRVLDLATPLRPDDKVDILHSIQGG